MHSSIQFRHKSTSSTPGGGRISSASDCSDTTRRVQTVICAQVFTRGQKFADQLGGESSQGGEWDAASFTQSQDCFCWIFASSGLSSQIFVTIVSPVCPQEARSAIRYHTDLDDFIYRRERNMRFPGYR